jgi:transposase
VPDNLKSAVNKASFYEPEINITYAELAEHYGFAVIPARPNHPRDKPKVETGVLIAKRWILAKLRHRTFYSLPELNAAVRELLEAMNNRLLRKLKKSRHELFEELDRPAAQALNARPYEYAEWEKARVNVDYHIEVESCYYSVPFRLIHEEVAVRLTANTVEVLFKGELVTAHARSRAAHSYTTKPEHMPPEHQKHLEWTPTRIIEWAGKTGPFTAGLVNRIMAGKAHPEQGYRACLGVLRLGKSYGAARLEAAAGRALHFNACTFHSVRSILASGLDRQRYVKLPAQAVLPFHENIRGGQYYSS